MNDQEDIGIRATSSHIGGLNFDAIQNKGRLLVISCQNFIIGGASRIAKQPAVAVECGCVIHPGMVDLRISVA